MVLNGTITLILASLIFGLAYLHLGYISLLFLRISSEIKPKHLSTKCNIGTLTPIDFFYGRTIWIEQESYVDQYLPPPLPLSLSLSLFGTHLALLDTWSAVPSPLPHVAN